MLKNIYAKNKCKANNLSNIYSMLSITDKIRIYKMLYTTVTSYYKPPLHIFPNISILRANWFPEPILFFFNSVSGYPLTRDILT